MRLRQLPQLYLRGAIANETMRHLGPKEQDNINKLTKEVIKSPLLAGHKHRFIEKLGHTIGCDYYKCKEAAEQEFSIAIWRALVYLLHHAECKYRCQSCDSTEYTTHSGKPKAIDRRFPSCPNCGAVRVGETTDGYQEGQFVNINDLKRAVIRGGVAAPKHGSPIVPIKGQKKIVNHEEILNDPQQFTRFFGEFVWNYFRQTLRENEIKQHQKTQRSVVGPADQVAVEEIVSMFKQLKIPNTYEPKANPMDGYYRIQVDIMGTPQSVSRALAVLIDKYATHDVKIDVSETEVIVQQHRYAPQVEAQIVSPQTVMIQGRSASDDDDSSVYDSFQHRIVQTGGSTMQEDGIANVETSDLIDTIRCSLSDGARQVFDIMTGQGQVFDEFEKYQRSPKGVQNNHYIERPKSTHISKFLGIPAAHVKQLIADIRIQCLAHGLSDG